MKLKIFVTGPQRMRLAHRDAELHELVIEGLSRLISANTDSGVKHSLAMAHDVDIGKRIIFSHVFARVMGQGAKFVSPDASVTQIGKSRLCEVRCCACCFLFLFIFLSQ